MTLLRSALSAIHRINSLQTSKNYPPISIHILSPSGHTLASATQDNCPPLLYPKYALSKAKVAVGLGISSREFSQKYISTSTSPNPAKISQMNNMAMLGDLACFPGGVVVRNSDNEIIAGIGVSGASGDQDEELASAGALEFTNSHNTTLLFRASFAELGTMRGK